MHPNPNTIYTFLTMRDCGDKFLGKIEPELQVELFGEVLGDGTIYICWTTGKIRHFVTTARANINRG